MKEFNNRAEAKKLAEYITGKPLREYLANKVKSYLGDGSITVFDGAVGSGQLQQFLNVKNLYGVEIQERACEVARENYPNSEIVNDSFFNFQNNDLICDVVVMNPPFSLKFKDLPESEQTKITEEFSWKKSGNLDDIFVLKSLKYAKRYGFYILFPGMTYRDSEKIWRDTLRNKVVELNVIKNGFEDTKIDVVFLVIDKEKESNNLKIKQEIYDCKCQKIIYETTEAIVEGKWQLPNEPKEEEEEIDFLKSDLERKEYLKTYVRNYFEFELMKKLVFNHEFISFIGLVQEIKFICDYYIDRYNFETRIKNY